MGKRKKRIEEQALVPGNTKAWKEKNDYPNRCLNFLIGWVLPSMTSSFELSRARIPQTRIYLEKTRYSQGFR
jgi:hypothetical protein